MLGCVVKKRTRITLGKALARVVGVGGAIALTSLTACGRPFEVASEAAPNARGAVLTLDRPAVMKVEISEGVRRALADFAGKADHERPALALDVICAPFSGADAPSVRVFLNKPNATRETSIEDPHFVTSFGLFPSGEAAPVSPETNRFNLDVTRTLERLARIGENIAGGDFTATFVATPRRATATDAGEVVIKHVALIAR